MTHKEIFRMFKRFHPLYCEDKVVWKPYGKNAISIHVMKGLIFIFTFNDNRHWRLETYNYYKKNTIPKGE